MCPDPETIALAEIASELREFDCMVGDARSYHTSIDGDKYPYVMLGFRGAVLDDVCAAFRKSLQMLRDGCRTKLTLYMRSAPHIERDSESHDWFVRMRLAVPGGNWTNVATKPEGLPYPKV